MLAFIEIFRFGLIIKLIFQKEIEYAKAKSIRPSNSFGKTGIRNL